jgi:hypothetical protein
MKGNQLRPMLVLIGSPQSGSERESLWAGHRKRRHFQKHKKKVFSVFGWFGDLCFFKWGMWAKRSMRVTEKSEGSKKQNYFIYFLVGFFFDVYDATINIAVLTNHNYNLNSQRHDNTTQHKTTCFCSQKCFPPSVCVCHFDVGPCYFNQR